MTATPRYFTDRMRTAASEVDLEVASMDDPKVFGPVFHHLSFSDVELEDEDGDDNADPEYSIQQSLCKADTIVLPKGVSRKDILKITAPTAI